MAAALARRALTTNGGVRAPQLRAARRPASPRAMPPPYLLAPDFQAAFDRSLGRPEFLMLSAAAAAAHELLCGYDSEEDEDEDDGGVMNHAPLLTLTLLVGAHAMRQLRASAHLELGGRSRITDAYAFDERTCRSLFRFSAQQLDELTHRLGLLDGGDKVVVGHDVFTARRRGRATHAAPHVSARRTFLMSFFLPASASS